MKCATPLTGGTVLPVLRLASHPCLRSRLISMSSADLSAKSGTPSRLNFGTDGPNFPKRTYTRRAQLDYAVTRGSNPDPPRAAVETTVYKALYQSSSSRSPIAALALAVGI